MPTLLRIKGHRFFFFSNESREPPHVHVKEAEKYAKFSLEPVELARNIGFRRNELTELHRIIGEHEQQFVAAWDEHFDG